MEKKRFHTRGFISLLTFGSFIVMTVNGIVLYFAPEGRIAHWVDWSVFGFSKEGWSDMHIVSSFLFVAVGIYHLVYNWKPFVSYVSKKLSGGLRLKKELVIAAAVSIYIMFAPVYHIFPCNYIVDFGGYLKKLSIIGPEYEPPFGGAEAVSLKSLAKRVNIDLERALAELRANGITVESGDTTLKKIAEENGTVPMKLYALMKKVEQKPESVQQASYTPELVEEKFSGTGFGRKTLAEMCKAAGVDINIAKDRLRKNNIEMKDDETMKDAATRRSADAIDILKVILVENYQLK
jgi:hypothetical protein